MAPLFENLPAAKKDENIHTMEEYNQGFEYSSPHYPAGIEIAATLTLTAKLRYHTPIMAVSGRHIVPGLVSLPAMELKWNAVDINQNKFQSGKFCRLPPQPR